jgi:hypothetical protein
MNLRQRPLRDLFWLGKESLRWIIAICLIGVAWVMLYRAGMFDEAITYAAANWAK